MKQKTKILIISIIIIILLVTTIFLISYNKPKNKIKRYLKKQDYICSEVLCTKTEQNERIDFNFSKGTMKILSYTFELKIEDNIYNYIDYTNSNICEINIKEKGEDIQEDNVPEDCKDYINRIEEYINLYNEILTNSNVNVNEL